MSPSLKKKKQTKKNFKGKYIVSLSFSEYIFQRFFCSYLMIHTHTHTHTHTRKTYTPRFCTKQKTQIFILVSHLLLKSTWMEWSMTRSAGQMGFIFSGLPPNFFTASRMAAKSTTAGTPLRNGKIKQKTNLLNKCYVGFFQLLFLLKILAREVKLSHQWSKW